MARITSLVHYSQPYRNAGSERVLDELLTAAATDGHDVTCVVTDNGVGTPLDYNGYRVERVRNVTIGAGRVRRGGAQVVITHHHNALYGIRQARLLNARSVLLTHNDSQFNKRALAMGPSLVVHNTEWVRDSLATFPAPGSEHTVIRPTVTPALHHVPETGDCITLVNLNEHKGVGLFYALAAAMPHHRFLGVEGGHGRQDIRTGYPNVEIVRHTSDMKAVWERTRVLIMPSVYESYGLVAAEAAVSGIPTVATRTPGLVENLGTHGLFVGGEMPGTLDDFATSTRTAKALAADPTPWMLALLALDDPETYDRAVDSAHVKAALDQADRDTSMANWLEWLKAIN